MNAHSMAKTAYSAPGRPTRTARGTEYDLFARITHRLKTAARLDKSGFPSLVRALNDNHQLWTALAADVLGSDNALPAALRARIFYLAEFTKVHTSRVLSGKADADVLVEINTAIMRGLRREGDAR